MKLVFYIRNLNWLGGAERGIISRANFLAERRHEVYLIVEQPFDRTANSIGKVSPEVHIVGPEELNNNCDYGGKQSRLTYLFNKIKFLHNISKWIARTKPDILILRAAGGGHSFFLIPHHGARFVNESLMTFNPKEYPTTFFRSIWFKWLSWRVDKYVLLTHRDIQSFPGPQKKAVVIHNPLMIKPLKADVDSKIVVSLGRLHFQKNYGALISAFAIVAQRHPDWQLHIYGEGPDKEALQQQIEQLNLTHSVILKGFTNDTAAAIASGSIFALSSKFEGLPNCVIEAAATGLPTVACEVNGCHEIMDGYDMGFIVPQNDIEAFADRLSYLIENPDERQRMGAAAFKRSQDFDRDKILDQYEALYRSLIK